MKITMDLAIEVRRLAEAGQLSHRAVARHLGISRASVANILHGRWKPRLKLHDEDDDPLGEQLGTPERCRGCGGRVYKPCRLCYVRGIKAREAARTATVTVPQPACPAPLRRAA